MGARALVIVGLAMLGLGIGILLGHAGAGFLIGLGIGHAIAVLLPREHFVQHKAGAKPVLDFLTTVLALVALGIALILAFALIMAGALLKSPMLALAFIVAGTVAVVVGIYAMMKIIQTQREAV